MEAQAKKIHHTLVHGILISPWPLLLMIMLHIPNYVHRPHLQPTCMTLPPNGHVLEFQRYLPNRLHACRLIVMLWIVVATLASYYVLQLKHQHHCQSS
jgi:hypothetical protein